MTDRSHDHAGHQPISTSRYAANVISGALTRRQLLAYAIERHEISQLGLARDAAALVAKDFIRGGIDG